MPKWERLWSDFLQEKLRKESLNPGQCKGEHDDDVALVGKGKAKARKGSIQGQSSGAEKKKYFSKVKCFTYRNFGHFTSQMPQ